MHDSLREAEARRRKSNKPRGKNRGLLLDLAAPQLGLAGGEHEQTVRRLLEALRVDWYDLQLVEPGAGQVGKVRRAVNVETLQKPEQINWLRRESALGQEIHIRPSRPEQSGLLLLSDLRKEQLNELTAIGLKPAVITELPGQSLQAWIRINKGGFDGIERDALSAFIEQQLGVRVDESYGRLPGFGGVQLLNADGGTSPSGQHMLQSIRDRLLEDNTRALQEALSAKPRTVEPEPLVRRQPASGLPSSNKAFALVAAEKADLAMAELEARLDREDDLKLGE